MAPVLLHYISNSIILINFFSYSHYIFWRRRFRILFRAFIFEHQLNYILRHMHGFFHRVALCHASGDIRDINRISNIFRFENCRIKNFMSHGLHHRQSGTGRRVILHIHDFWAILRDLLISIAGSIADMLIWQLLGL